MGERTTLENRISGTLARIDEIDATHKVQETVVYSSFLILSYTFSKLVSARSLYLEEQIKKVHSAFIVATNITSAVA